MKPEFNLLCPECGKRLQYHAGIGRPVFYSCDVHGKFLLKPMPKTQVLTLSSIWQVMKQNGVLVAWN